MQLQDMSKDERSLLLFFETCHVDHGGLVDVRHMNDDDRHIAEVWNQTGFVSFGRVAFHDVERINKNNPSHRYTSWCFLSEEAFKLAHEERKARAVRMWTKRGWKKAREE